MSDIPISPELIEAAKAGGARLIAPMESFFEKSEAGKMFVDVYKNQIVPATHKAIDAGLEEAKKYGVPDGMIGPQPSAGSIISKATNIGRRAGMGHNDYVGAALIQAAHKEKGSVYANAMADHVAMLFHDNVESTLYKTSGDAKAGRGHKVRVSSFKENVNSLQMTNEKLDNVNSPYTPVGKVEQAYHSAINTVAAPLIAIPHASNFVNMALRTPLTSLTKGLMETMGPANYRNAKQLLLGSGVLADTQFTTYKELQMYKSGKIAQMTTPTVGYILNKLIHAPGFNAVREWTLVAAGSTAKHVAEDSGQKIMTEGLNGRSARILQRMGIDPALVHAQGGKINPDQLEKGIFRFVDDNVFLDTKLARSYYAQSNWFFRAGTMFHGYTSQQVQFIKKGMIDVIKNRGEQGGLVDMAKFFATLGIAFPLVGEVVNQAERLARGQSLDIKERFENITGQHGLDQAALEYIDALAHVASFGIWASYARSVARMQLASTMLGPGVNMASQFGQDAVNMVAHPHRKAPKVQLGRDIIEDLPTGGLGRIFVHRFMPTRTEENQRHPKFHKYRKPRKQVE